MSSNMDDCVKRLREERVAREQARIQKLRELNMKKYPTTQVTSSSTNLSIAEKKIASTSRIKTGAIAKNIPANVQRNVKSSVHVNCTAKRPISVPVGKRPDYTNVKPKVVTKFATKNDAKSGNHDLMKKKSEINVAPVQKSTTNRKKKPSISNFDMVLKPDIIITENSDNGAELVAGNVQKSDTKIAVVKNIDNKTKQNNKTTNDVPSKPDIIITTQNDNVKKSTETKVLTEITKKVTIHSKLFKKNDVKLRKSFAPTSTRNEEKPKINARKSILPMLLEGTKSESVFDRLYKPKCTKRARETISDAEKLRTDPSYLKKVIKNADLIYNMHQQKKTEQKFHQRRSISAVHFKRISKSEVSNCIHKWGSIGDNLDKIDLHEPEIKDERVTSAVKSERKKVQFLTPSLSRFNTPGSDELQARLRSWLQKRGKSLTSHQHLQCFGLRNLKVDFDTPKSISSVPFEDALQSPRFDDENKENIALESDSDDGSFTEIMNEPKETLNPGDKIDVTNWRNVSVVSESVFNESNMSRNFNDTTLTPAMSDDVNDLLHGALNDLSALLREGFEWQAAARWLRSIRARFPHAPRTAAYWECRAALEDARGNLTASLDAWNEALVKGTEESVVDANLDQLLNKFMQLKISPGSGAPRHPDPKLVDVKNVFKSTIIKFAVQQARLRNSQAESPAPFTVTPVRRSARLSHCVSRTPLRLCDTVRQAATLAPEHVFTPNDNFVQTP